LYGKADFRDGASEPEDEVPVKTPTDSSSTSEPPSTPKPPAAVVPEEETSSEGFTILQKGLFFAVILGCIAAYLRMSNKKNTRYREKSMV